MPPKVVLDASDWAIQPGHNKRMENRREHQESGISYKLFFSSREVSLWKVEATSSGTSQHITGLLAVVHSLLRASNLP